jgi:transposase
MTEPILGSFHDELRLVAEQSHHTLAEYVELLRKRYRLITSVPVLSRTLKALGLPPKKRHPRRSNATGLKPSGRGDAFKPD